MPDMKKKTTLKNLEAEALTLGYKVIYEKGTFQSNACLVRDKKIIVINRLLEDDSKYASLREIVDKVILENAQMITDQSEE